MYLTIGLTTGCLLLAWWVGALRHADNLMTGFPGTDGPSAPTSRSRLQRLITLACLGVACLNIYEWVADASSAMWAWVAVAAVLYLRLVLSSMYGMHMFTYRAVGVMKATGQLDRRL